MLTQASHKDLIYDWNRPRQQGTTVPRAPMVLDETLREGLQNASVRDPSMGAKLRLLHLMNTLGVQRVNIGMPASSPRAFEDALRICQEIANSKLAIFPACAARTLEGDIHPIVEIAQKAGVPIQIYTFVGSSPIRQLVEGWDEQLLAERAANAIDVGIRAGLPVAFVTEDTTRSQPDLLARLFRIAVEHGANRICLCDTAGHATPDGVRHLIHFTRSVLKEMGAGSTIQIDWHGHNDRGLALANALCALEAGVDCIHATALGIGERVGNVPMELLLLNLKLQKNLESHDLSRLVEYCQTAAEALGWNVPFNYPLVGRDAFRTATGVHAAAILKAKSKGDPWLADRIYSSVPAGLFGKRQEIQVGPQSGASNVVAVLKEMGIEPSKLGVHAVLQAAKNADHVLSKEEILKAMHKANL